MKYKLEIFFVALAVTLLVPALVITESISQTEQKEQLIITKNNIKSIDSFGEYEKINPEYTNFYNASNLFDNKINSYSFFSEYGPSGFTLELNNPLPQPVCGIEIVVYNPKGTAFNFGLNDKLFTGILNGENAIGEIEPCVKDLTKLSMNFNADKKWTTLAEVKLFTNTSIIIEPPVCEPGTHYDPVLKQCVPDVIIPPTEPNITKIDIVNSTALVNVTDSTIVLNLDVDTVVKTNLTDDNIDEDNDKEDDKEEEEDDN